MKKPVILFWIIALAAMDQGIKIWALQQLAPVHQIPVIAGFFNLTYVENRGAAFGILQGRTTLLIAIVSLVLLVVIAYLLVGKPQGLSLEISLLLIVAGGAGNLIDRAYRGFVVDYLDFSSLFGFPVFNFADCCVVIGTFLMVLVMFYQDYIAAKAVKNAGEDSK
jgi:lipoprotein signal peptidase